MAKTITDKAEVITRWAALQKEDKTAKEGADILHKEGFRTPKNKKISALWLYREARSTKRVGRSNKSTHVARARNTGGTNLLEVVLNDRNLSSAKKVAIFQAYLQN